MNFKAIKAQAKDQSDYFVDARHDVKNTILAFGRTIACQVTVPNEQTTAETLVAVIEKADKAVATELLANSGLTVNALVNLKLVQELTQVRNTILKALGLSPADLDLENLEEMKCKYSIDPQDLSDIQWALNSIVDQCRTLSRACIVTPIMEEE